jgi:hypothetical protein
VLAYFIVYEFGYRVNTLFDEQEIRYLARCDRGGGLKIEAKRQKGGR